MGDIKWRIEYSKHWARTLIEFPDFYITVHDDGEINVQIVDTLHLPSNDEWEQVHVEYA